MEDHARLEPTSALVMLWCRDRYLTGSASRFYSLLDLSAGEEMRRECDEACPWYEQVTLNRKWLIRHLAGEFIGKADGLCQVVLPAAGKCPLALELLDDCNERISSVIEIDIRGMDEKEQLYRQAVPELAGKIRCVTADLFDLREMEKAIRETGIFDPALPTLVIPEGISYYIPRDLLSGIIGLFASPDHTNRAIFDYMLPCRLVKEDRRRYPQGIWRIINRDCNQQETITYSLEELKETLGSAGCNGIVQHSMHEMERLRTGRNEYFTKPDDGWIQIAEVWV